MLFRSVQGTQAELHVKNDATNTLTAGGWDGSRHYIKSINLGVALTPLTLQASSFTFDTGNVGIGTTSPGYKLDVLGDSRFTGTISGNSNFELTNASGPYVLVGEGTGASQYGVMDWDATNNRLRIATQPYAFGANGGQINLTTGGSVGIGTTAPSQQLHVAASLTDNVGITVQNTNASYSSQYRWLNSGGSQVAAITWVPSDSSIRIWNNGNDRIIINSGGSVGIGTTSPSYLLDVSGTIRATGDVIAYSDARVKENVETISNALETVTSLRGVSYTRKDTDDKSRKVGVIAQEVLDILPEVVQQDTNGNYSVAYGNIVGVLIEAIKELKAEINELKNNK